MYYYMNVVEVDRFEVRFTSLMEQLLSVKKTLESRQRYVRSGKPLAMEGELWNAGTIK